MATILFAAAGSAIGAGFGGSILGLSGAVIGRAVGATAGRLIDQRVMSSGSEPVEAGRIDRFQIMGASEGSPIAQCWGRMRLPGQVIWASPFHESATRSGGKGMPSPRVVQYTYSVSLAIALCQGEILGVGRIWADGDEISPASLNFRVYHGTEDQLPDPLLEVVEGAGTVPAYRGIAYVVIEALNLSPFGNRVPQFSFEVLRRGQGLEAAKVNDLQDVIRGVSLIPGTGEFALSTHKVWRKTTENSHEILNVNSPSGETDFATSLRQLQQELPNCAAVSLVVSWFGDDLRCSECQIRPKVEALDAGPTNFPWRSGGIGREEAGEVPRSEGKSIYGGTPSDVSIIEAIKALQSAGQSVLFYPFILMEQGPGNYLPDPYTGQGSQPTLPWRGRITLSIAPGRSASPDQTEIATSEVSQFFGNAQSADFSVVDDEIVYSGPEDWGYRRFILHYALLCKIAGGVEAFCIGSEMRGLTQIRGPDQSFPAVEALCGLAREVRNILGPDVKISYAADWSEYFGYRADGNHYFHLDSLWALPEIDFVGIDNYMPVSDWRDGLNHKDSVAQSIYNLEYLQGNIMGGEGFDWFYDGPEAARLQLRTRILDAEHGEDWVFKYKDLRSWWSNLHHNRVDGERLSLPTEWVPESKPIRFTEYGCPAIDKGTNEPNKFVDTRSSESAVPRFSTGERDDLIQMQYYRAHGQFWEMPENNPVSALYPGTMVDFSRCYAWAWDARPFPYFPRNTENWSDGGNYHTGHWLNGRASSAPLERVVREVCEQREVIEVDTSRLFGLVYGYTISELSSVRAVIQPLSTVWAFDPIEADGHLRFQSRLLLGQLQVSELDVSLTEEGKGSLEFVRGSSIEAGDRFVFTSIGAEGNFGAIVAEATPSKAATGATIDVDYPVLVPTGLAKTVVDRWMIEASLSLDRASFRLPPSMLSVNVGDTVSIYGHSYRIDRCDIAGDVSVDAVRSDHTLYQFGHSVADLGEWKPHQEPGPLSRFWLDIPWTNSDKNVNAPFLAVAVRSWSDQIIVWSGTEDSDYSVNTVIEVPSGIGITVSALDPCMAGVVDRGEPLTIHLNGDFLESISMDALLFGKNYLAIGDGEVDGWEIIQFQTATMVAPNVFKISNRLRGLFGTEVTKQWPAGSSVVVLDDRLSQITLPVDHRGVSAHYRIARASEALSSDLVVHDVLAFEGVALRPYSVVHGQSITREDGSHKFTWIRRGRTAGDSWNGYEVPLAEEAELYSVLVRNSSAVIVRSVSVSVPEFSYSAEMQVLDNVTSTYTVEVAQVSAIYGRGRSTIITQPCLI